MQKIINIIDNLEPINFGIWNAAIATAGLLKTKYGIESELWYPRPSKPIEEKLYPTVLFREIKLENRDSYFLNLNPEETIIVTHGAWQYPTKWGRYAKKNGFGWVYTPHGMLEPWSLQVKKWKKSIYLETVEKPYALKADYIRAVGSPEAKNLEKFFPSEKIQLIPNGVPFSQKIHKNWEAPFSFLFMSRLHFKKGIYPLVNAWVQSEMNNHPKFKLTIAGPDQGELEKIAPLIKEKSFNIKYIGPIYGADKNELLKKSHFFILPSYSEGFPTSVIEAMQYGLIPFISEGCNFPEAFKKGLGVKVEPAELSIIQAMNTILDSETEELKNWSEELRTFIHSNYSIDKIAQKQNDIYQLLCFHHAQN